MALCTDVSRANSVETRTSTYSLAPVQIGVPSNGKGDDLTSFLQAKLQEQSKDILRFVDAKLEKQMTQLNHHWQTQKVDIELILDSKLQQWFCGEDLSDVHLPIPPDIDEPNGENENLIGDKQQKSMKDRDLMRQQFIEVCGWQMERKDSSNTIPVTSRMQSKRQGDLVGFEPEAGCQSRMSYVIHSALFQSTSAILVLSNSVMIAIQLDLDMVRALDGKDVLPWEGLSDLCFTSFFFVELVLRCCAERTHFYRGPGRYWNFFDMVVVATGIVDLIRIINFSLTFLRILRILRIIRVLRVLRIFKFCRELRLMALSIVSCLRSLVWAFLLLLVAFFVFSLVLLESARDYLRGDNVDQTVWHDINDHYHGVWMSIYTLIQSVSGGNSWGDVAECFVTISWMYGVAFTCFIIFVLFGLLNVLVGVFVQNTEAIAHIDRDFVIQEEMERKNSLINQMRDLFNVVDADNSGTITWQELRANLDDDCMKAYFSTMQLEIDEAKGLFKLLDTDESGEVAIEEFIVGCMRLKGTAKSIDLASMLYDNKKLHSMLQRYMEGMTEKLLQIQSSIAQQLQGSRRMPIMNLPSSTNRSPSKDQSRAGLKVNETYAKVV